MKRPDNESILIDQDGVLADTMGRVYDIVERESKIDLCHHDNHDYWFEGMPADVAYLTSILRRTGFYDDLDLITGAARGVKRLRKLYNDNVFICSSPMSGADNCESEKRDWIAREFDVEFAERAIITSDKGSVPGRILIDDNPHADVKTSREWELVLFSQRWNQHREDVPRMNGWHELDVVFNAMKARVSYQPELW